MTLTVGIDTCHSLYMLKGTPHFKVVQTPMNPAHLAGRRQTLPTNYGSGLMKQGLLWTPPQETLLLLC